MILHHSRVNVKLVQGLLEFIFCAMVARRKRNRWSLRWWLPAGIFLVVTIALTARPAVRAYRLGRVRKALESHHPDSALQWLLAAERSDPESAEIQFLLARTQRKLGNLATAREHLQRAWSLGYSEASVQREEWMALAQTGQLRESEPKLRAHLSRSSEDAQEICEALVAGYLNNYNANAARTWLDAWQADFPESAQPHFFRGLIWRHFMLYDRATDELNQALELDPTRYDIRFELAKTLETKHEFAAAVRLYRVCREDRSDDPQVLTGLANCQVHLGKEDEAVSLYQHVVQQWPEEVYAHLGLAKLDLARNDPDSVVRRLGPLAQEHPYNKEVRYALASALRSVGQDEEAETHFAFVREANEALADLEPLLEQVREDPKSVPPRYQVGRTILLYASPAKGAAWLRSVLELDPQHRAAHRLLADYYAKQENWPLAEQHRKLAGPVDNMEETR